MFIAWSTATALAAQAAPKPSVPASAIVLAVPASKSATSAILAASATSPAAVSSSPPAARASAPGSKAAAAPGTPACASAEPAPDATAPVLRGLLVVTVDGLDAKDVKNDALLTKVCDLADPTDGTMAVTFERATAVAAVGGQRRWIVPMAVTAMPGGVTLTRYVSLWLGTVPWTLPYQITSPTAPAVTWSLGKALSAQGRLFEKDNGVPFSVIVAGGGRLTGMTVARSELVEATSRQSIVAGDWRVCAGKPCKPIGTEGLGGGVTALWMAPPAGFELAPGKYESLFTLGAAGKNEGGESITTVLYYSTWKHKAFGVVAIIVGLVLSWGVTIFLRRWVERSQLMLPAARLKQRLEKIAGTLKGLTPSTGPTPLSDLELQRLLDGLSFEALVRNGLPAVVPPPWTAVALAGSANAQLLATYLNGLSARTDVLQTLAERGFETLAVLTRGVAWTPDLENALAKANEDLDKLALTPQTQMAQFDDAIKAAIDGFRQALNKAGLGGAGPDQVVEPVLPSASALEIRIRNASELGWIFVFIVTVALGTYVLIWQNPGFGTCIDYATCMLWGLGFASGASLLSLTNNSVLTTFNTR